VARCRDLAHQSGLLLGYPTKHEECRFSIESPEKLQDPPRVVGDAARVLRPVVRPDAVGEGFHVIVIFDVNAEPARKTARIAWTCNSGGRC
jgi:hypothetical protein